MNVDYNSGDTLGTCAYVIGIYGYPSPRIAAFIQSTSGGGQRSSSANRYIHPALVRPNLDILLNAQVTRLLNLNDSCTDARPDMRGVEFAQGPGSMYFNDFHVRVPDILSPGQRFTVKASKEVILSAGGVNSAQILLLSGVGNATELAALNIPSVIDLPGVGRNLQDHPLLALQWSTTSNETIDNISRNATLASELMAQWEKTHSGQFSSIIANAFSWLRLPPNTSEFIKFGDPSAGPTSAHVELIFEVFIQVIFLEVDRLNLSRMISLLSLNRRLPTAPSSAWPPELSRPPLVSDVLASTVKRLIFVCAGGSVTLSSADPFTFPDIDPAFLEHPTDQAVIVASIQLAQTVFAQSPWQGLHLTPFGALANAKTDGDLLEIARSNAVSFWHPCCTAKMGAAHDKMSVVDSSLHLIGANGLRVVDSSVWVSV
jgi:choline dehydrogenase-like flavoprotein